MGYVKITNYNRSILYILNYISVISSVLTEVKTIVMHWSTDLDLAESERMSRMCWPMRVMATESKDKGEM